MPDECDTCGEHAFDWFAQNSIEVIMDYVDSTPIFPEQPIKFIGLEGFETYCIDDHTIGVRPKWISVEDALPDEHQEVLVFGDFGIAIDKISFPKDGNLWNLTCNDSITHWMPLPKPPEAEYE